MKRSLYLAMCCAVVLFAASAFATDGVVLINQNTSVNGLPGCAHSGFPITICQSGSYKLSGNLTVAQSNVAAISITTDDVTLDLNGFSISGPLACPTAACDSSVYSSVGIHSGNKNIAVINGTVQGFFYGLQLGPGDNGAAPQHVEKVTVHGNASGMYVSAGIVTLCRATSNRDVGIELGPGIASHNYMTFNGTGLDMSDSGIAQANLAMWNRVSGLQLSSGVGFMQNTAIANSFDIAGGTNQGQNTCTNLSPC